jgi:hypothetical protein
MTPVNSDFSTWVKIIPLAPDLSKIKTSPHLQLVLDSPKAKEYPRGKRTKEQKIRAKLARIGNS